MIVKEEIIFFRSVNQVGKMPKSFDLKTNFVLAVFVLWSLLQAVFPLQFLPFDLVQSMSQLKVLLPALGILLSCLINLDRLKLNNIAVSFLLFCLFTFMNIFLQMLFTGVDFKQLSQPVLYLIWTICMFVLVPSVFNNLSKIKIFLWITVLLLVFTVIYSIYYSYISGFKIMDTYGGSREGAVRYSFSYLNPSYLGGICYSVICSCLMLQSLSKYKWQKILLLSFILLSFVMLYLSSSRTYILGTSVLYIYYFWYKGGLWSKLARIMVLFSLVLFIQILLKLSIDDGFLYSLNFYSSNRLAIWLNEIHDKMLNGVEWKIFVGNGFIIPDWIQGIVLAEGRVEKGFMRYAVDNLYLEFFILHGIIGLILFLRGLIYVIKTISMINELSERVKMLKIPFIIAHGSIMGLIVGGFFCSHFPSLGNTVNSLVFPVSVGIIFICKECLQKIRNKES